MTLTLQTIGILLHYAWSPHEHPDCLAQAGGWRESINALQREGLIEAKQQPRFDATYEVTGKGMVYVEAIRHTPLPTLYQEWRVPNTFPSQS